MCQRAITSYWKTSEIKLEQRRALTAKIVAMEMEGKSNAEIAAACGMDHVGLSAFRYRNHELFREEYERVSGDARLSTVKAYIHAEKRLARMMPAAADAIQQVLNQEDVPPAVKARTSLELIKLMRQDGVKKRLLEVDEAFAELAKDTAQNDITVRADVLAEEEAQLLFEGEPEPIAAPSEGAELENDMRDV